MKKYFFIFLIIATSAISADVLDWSDHIYKHTDIVLVNTAFDARISDTEILRQKGLSGFSDLKNNQAMLFIFPNADIYGFWMKEMLFAIDIVWLDDGFKVVSLKKNVSPDTYPKVFYPKTSSKYVIELRAGTIDALGLKEGDSLSIHGGKFYF